METTVNDIHLLLVEDNEELLYLMERILSRRYHVMMAKNGVEALELMKDNEVDIIVSDVMMPEMDGLELCRTIKGNLETSHIPIILLTAKIRQRIVLNVIMPELMPIYPNLLS